MKHGHFLQLVLSAIAVGVAAQTRPQHFNYTVDTSQVDVSTKAEWCAGQRSVCDTLCGAPKTYPQQNDCKPETLDYTCTCQNGTAPGLEYYVNSLPTFLCEEAFKQCNTANVGNANGQSGCLNNIKSKCGTQDASTVTAGSGGATGTTTSPSPASTVTGQSGGSSPSPTSSSTAVAAPTQIHHFAGMAAAAVLMAAVAQQPLW